MLLLNINRKSLMGSLMALSLVTLSDLERSKIKVAQIWKTYLAKEPSSALCYY